MTPGGTTALLAFFAAAERFARAEVDVHGEAKADAAWAGEDLIRRALHVASRDVRLGPDEVVRARATFERLWRENYLGCAASDAWKLLRQAGEMILTAERTAGAASASQRERDKGPAVARLAIARAKG